MIAIAGGALVAMAAGFATSVAAGGPEAAPSFAELREVFDRGDHVQFLKLLPPALVAPADSYDRCALYMMRGEAQLRTNLSPTAAADSYRQAAREAPDEPRASLARATEFLMRRCGKTGYVSKARPKPAAGRNAGPAQGVPPAPEPAPIDVIEASSRKAAFAALFEDEAAARSRDLAKAARATSLDAVMSAATPLPMLADIERAAVESAPQTAKLADDLTAHACVLISQTNKKLTDRVRALESEASRMIYIGTHEDANNRYGVRTPAGLTTPQEREVMQIRETCVRISEACRELREPLAQATGKADFADVEKVQRTSPTTPPPFSRSMRQGDPPDSMAAEG